MIQLFPLLKLNGCFFYISNSLICTETSTENQFTEVFVTYEMTRYWLIVDSVV